MCHPYKLESIVYDQKRLWVGLPLEELLQYHCTYDIKSPYDNIYKLNKIQ